MPRKKKSNIDCLNDVNANSKTVATAKIDKKLANAARQVENKNQAAAQSASKKKARNAKKNALKKANKAAAASKIKARSDAKAAVDTERNKKIADETAAVTKKRNLRNRESNANKVVQLQALVEKLKGELKKEKKNVESIKNMSGLSRINLVSQAWHDEHETVAHDLFGTAGNFLQAKIFLACTFPEVDMSVKGNPGTGVITVFEKILICLLHWYSDLSPLAIGLIYGIHSSYVLRLIKFIAPYLGEAAQDIHILDLDEEYLLKCIPNDFRDTLHLKTAAIQADGKAWPCDSDRKSARIRKVMYCNKIGGPGVQVMAWMDSTGLYNERTPVSMGSGGENIHFKIWGEAGMSKTPAKDSPRCPGDMLPELSSKNRQFAGEHKKSNQEKSEKEIAKADTARVRTRVKEVAAVLNAKNYIPAQHQSHGREAYDRYRGENDEDEYEPEDVEDEEVDAVEVHDDAASDGEVEIGHDHDASQHSRMITAKNMYATSRDNYIQKLKSLQKPDLDSHNSSSTAPPMQNGPHNKQMTKKEKKKARKSGAMAEDAIDAAARKLRDQRGPNASAARKIQQLQRLERLHEAYSTGKLIPCLLSYYLWSTVELRSKLLRGLLDPPVANKEQFRISTRLAKYPASISCVNDRGMVKFSQYMPRFNFQHSPSFINQRSQFHFEEMLADREIKRLRYVPEVGFARVQDMKILQGRLRYRNFPIADHIIGWGFARANQLQPLKNPPDWEIYKATLPRK